MLIRPATINDVDAICALEAQQSFPWSPNLVHSSFGALAHNHVVCIEQQIVGFALSQLVAGEASLLNLFVAPSYRRQGIANALLTQHIDALQQAQAFEVWLEVRVSNVAAIALYQQLGFIEQGIRANYYDTQSGREDALVMCLPCAWS